MNSIEQIKQKALENHIPIIMDDTLEVVAKILEEIKPKKILEIGTAVGYSAIRFSDYLCQDGYIDTIERDEERIKEAIQNIQDMNLQRKIHIFKGDALEILPTLNGHYDVIFIDAAKGKYPIFLSEALRMLSNNGIIIADNVLYKGYVMSDYNKHKQRTAVRGLREFLKKLDENETLVTEIINVGDGLTISKKMKRSEKKMKKPELLAPAGSFEKAKVAFEYGADSVYCGTSKLSLRSRVEIDDSQLAKIIQYAHSINKKVYVPLNIYARDNMYNDVKEQIKMLDKIKADGVIVSDGGIVEAVKELAPNLQIHISTQANTVSYHTSKFWYNNGAKRIILARELNKEEIKDIIKNKPKDLEMEIFVHGAICYGYSGRCHLSDFLAGRGANLGDCAQSCRWAYNIYLEEKNNPGLMMPVEQDEHGTYVLSSKDMCLIKELPEIIQMEVDSLKIEGRLKTEYYLATVINTYRTAIDDYIKNPEEYDYTKYLNELEKTKTRGLTTFYFNDKNNKDFQEYEGKQYNPNYEFGGKVQEYKKEKSIIEIKNRIQIGDILELIIPNQITPYRFTVDKLWDVETDEEIDFVNPGKEGQKVKLHVPVEAKENWILRRQK